MRAPFDVLDTEPPKRNAMRKRRPPVIVRGSDVRVPTACGTYFVIDVADWQTVAGHSWSLSDGYPATRIRGRLVKLQKHLLDAPAGLERDHKDGDRLNNRRANLRHATSTQNGANQRIRRDNKSGYRGVIWDKSRNRWQANIKANNRRITLGRFDTAEEAARAYDTTARERFGEFARLNFPRPGENGVSD